MAAGDDKKKTTIPIVKSLTEALEKTEKKGLGAKKSAQFLDKILAGYTGDILDLFKDGLDVNKIGVKNQEVIAKAASAAGLDITEGDERRALETTKNLLEISYQIKKTAIKTSQETAKGFKSMGLKFQRGWLEAGNFWNKGLIKLQEGIANHADIKNLGSAISQDFSILTTEFSGLMAMPGMKTIVTTLQFIGAWLLKWMTPIIKKWLMGDKEAGTKGVLQRAGRGIKSLFMGQKREFAGAEDEEGTKIGGRYASEYKQANIFGKIKYGLGKLHKNISAGMNSALEAGQFLKTGMTKQQREIKAAIDFLTPKGTPGHEKKMKALAKKEKGYFRRMRKFFSEKDERGMTKARRAFRKGQAFFKIGIRKISRGFKKFGRNLLKAAKKLAIRALGFIVNVGIWLVNMLIMIAGFIAANIITIAIIAAIVLLAIGLYFLVKYIMDNWEKIKVRFNMAVDKFKLGFKKIGNWFKDLGEDIVYKIKWLIAKIKDGIASMANKVITKLNKIPGVNIEKWDASRTEKLEGERGDILGGRIDRDQQLLADFKALSQERGKQLETAAQADADRKAKKDAGVTGGNQQINTSIETDNREVHMSSESTQPTDYVGMRANMSLDQ